MINAEPEHEERSRFCDDVVALARRGDAPLNQISEDFGITEGCLWNWMNPADIDEGVKPGLTSDERAEPVRLRRELRVKEMEIEIPKRASAYLARENVLAEG